MEKLLNHLLSRADTILGLNVIDRRSLSAVGITQAKNLLRYFRQPELARPAGFDTDVCHVMILLVGPQSSPELTEYQRSKLVEASNLAKSLLRLYRRPELDRPPNFDKEVCRSLLLFGEGGLFD